MYIPSTQGSPLARETISVAGHCPLGEYKDPIESNSVRPKMQHTSRAMGGVVGVESQFLHTHNYTHIHNTLTRMLARDTQIYTQREEAKKNSNTGPEPIWSFHRVLYPPHPNEV